MINRLGVENIFDISREEVKACGARRRKQPRKTVGNSAVGAVKHAPDIGVIRIFRPIEVDACKLDLVNGAVEENFYPTLFAVSRRAAAQVLSHGLMMLDGDHEALRKQRLVDRLLEDEMLAHGNGTVSPVDQSLIEQSLKSPTRCSLKGRPSLIPSNCHRFHVMISTSSSKKLCDSSARNLAR